MGLLVRLENGGRTKKVLLTFLPNCFKVRKGIRTESAGDAPMDDISVYAVNSPKISLLISSL
jgi:hypothetical protein